MLTNTHVERARSRTLDPGDDIGWSSKTEPTAQEVIPGGPVGPLGVAAGRTVLRDIGRIDLDHGHLATTSDAANYSGRRLQRYRRRQPRKKARVQGKRTRCAAKLLAEQARREAR